MLTPWGYDEVDNTAYLQPPSAEHWFGTTQIGLDVFAQTMRGLQKSLVIGLLVGVISTGLASIVGAAAGYFGGWTDRVLIWLVDLLLVLPGFLVIAILSLPDSRSLEGTPSRQPATRRPAAPRVGNSVSRSGESQ